MAGQASLIVLTLVGSICMLAGIAFIIAGSIGLYNYYYFYSHQATSWTLLWVGIGLDLIGSSFFGLARRMQRQQRIRDHCEHAHSPCRASNGGCLAPPPVYIYPPPGYTAQGFSSQPLNVPPSATFPASATPPNYEYAVPPQASQAPPAYEAPK